jgi:hypothetical protein
MALTRRQERDWAKAEAEGELARLTKEIAGMDPVHDADDIAMLQGQVAQVEKFLDEWPDCMMTAEELFG